MIIFRLEKMSSPAWDNPKDFLSQTECAEELAKHICDGCLNGDDTDWGQANGDRTLGALLNTPCGYEYYVEEIEIGFGVIE
jgi:hypothetical protein